MGMEPKIYTPSGQLAKTFFHVLGLILKLLPKSHNVGMRTVLVNVVT